MSFQSMCKEHVRHRRAKLAKFVSDAFFHVFAPVEVLDDDMSEIAHNYHVNIFNRMARTPLVTSTISEPPSTEILHDIIPGSTLVVAPNAPVRIARLGDKIEWTLCQLYLYFLQHVSQRIPGIPITVNSSMEIEDEQRPDSVSVGTRELEAWIQMTVSAIPIYITLSILTIPLYPI
jgi:hypothetical protein